MTILDGRVYDSDAIDSGFGSWDIHVTAYREQSHTAKQVVMNVDMGDHPMFFGWITMNWSPTQARRLAEHLVAAADAAEGGGE